MQLLRRAGPVDPFDSFALVREVRSVEIWITHQVGGRNATGRVGVLYDSTTSRDGEATTVVPCATSRGFRRKVPERPPVFSHRASSPITIDRSADLHMS